MQPRHSLYRALRQYHSAKHAWNVAKRFSNNEATSLLSLAYTVPTDAFAYILSTANIGNYGKVDA